MVGWPNFQPVDYTQGHLFFNKRSLDNSISPEQCLKENEQKKTPKRRRKLSRDKFR